MALQSEVLPRVAPNDLPDDTAESVLGAEQHQEAIGALAWSLRVAADRARASWDVTETVGLDGLAHLDGSRYTPRPDVMVLPTALPSKSDATAALAQVGVPLFVAEVASPSTVLNDRRGKRATYAGVGIAEYFIFDPAGTQLGQVGVQVEAWRLPRAGARQYVRWLPEEDGAWRSAALGVRLHVAGLFVQVEDAKGALIPPIVAALREHEETLRLYAVSEREREEAVRTREEALRAVQGVLRARDRLEEERGSALRERDAERAARQRVEQERQQAEQQRQQAESQRQQAESQRQQAELQRQQADERIRALEEEVRRLRGR